MMTGMRVNLAVMVLGIVGAAARASDPPPRSAREALQVFNDLIGSWKATGTLEKSRTVRQPQFWKETVQWEWHFQGPDAWLQATFDAGKYFTTGMLRPLPARDRFAFTVTTPDQQTRVFIGEWKDRRLTLDRQDEPRNETQRLVITLLHPNRFLYSYQVKPRDRGLFTRVYQVGATKEGVPFATAGSSAPECIVSGGLGTIAVRYQGQTYYVCCGGCRSEFNADPEKYIKEYQENKARERKQER